MSLKNSGVYGLPKSNSGDEIWVSFGNGYGNDSPQQSVRRFTTIISQIGSSIDYIDNVAFGALFIIKVPGVYALSYTDECARDVNMGISLNYDDTSIYLSSIPDANRLCRMYIDAAEATVGWATATAIKYLNPGDRIRPLSDAQPSGQTNGVQFRITRIS